MGGTSRAARALAIALALVACRRPRTPDTNLLTGRCTNREHSRASAPRIPPAPAPISGFGAIVGTLADSGGALPHYPILAGVPGDPPNAPHASATADSVGGFAFASLLPGTYRLR
ncbi:MAG TPA: hypothetical protein VGD02_02365, partial [Gemmatimonadaceae bacterium]